MSKIEGLYFHAYSDTGFIDENIIPAPLQYFLARLGGAGSNAVATSRTSCDGL